MTGKRVFFAIVPSEPSRSLLSHFLDSLKLSMPVDFMKWSQVENLHVTLQFLNGLEEKDLVALIESVHSALKNYPIFEFQLSKLEWFPGQDHPKFLSLSTGAQETLKELSVLIGQVLSMFNYAIESRPFRAHMTLGRIVNKSASLPVLQQTAASSLPVLFVDRIFLIESKPGKERSNYCPLAQFDLSKG